ncbi:hypothetical protein LCGC14_3078270, partial [marine sediment metagenome]
MGRRFNLELEDWIDDPRTES